MRENKYEEINNVNSVISDLKDKILTDFCWNKYENV